MASVGTEQYSFEFEALKLLPFCVSSIRVISSVQEVCSMTGLGGLSFGVLSLVASNLGFVSQKHSC